MRDVVITALRIYADYHDYSFTTSFTAKVKTFLQMTFLYYLLFIYTLDTISYVKEHYSHTLQILKNPEAIQIALFVVMLATVGTGIEYLLKNKAMIKRIFSSDAE